MKEHIYETTVLVPARWSQLSRYHSLPRLPQRKTWWSDNFKKHRLSLAAFLTGFIPFGFGVWNYATVNTKKRQPSTTESLKVVVEDVLSAMSKDLVWKIVRHVRNGVLKNGRYFEQFMYKCSYLFYILQPKNVSKIYIYYSIV